MKKSYSECSNFWDRNEPKMMGDFVNRPKAIKLLGNIKGKKILDAGCGTGYVSRILSQKGGIIYGCDNGIDMLKVAIDFENKLNLNIIYTECNIEKTGYDNNFFDGIICIGVLMHLNLMGIQNFIEEAYRILKKRGKLIVCVLHPFLFNDSSPARMKKNNWIILKPIKKNNDSRNDFYKEIYIDILGHKFESNLYNHSIESYVNLLLRSKFIIKKLQEVDIKKENILVEEWGNKYGYPAYLQLKAIKII